MLLSFTKMHGAGNDFAVIDSRERPFDEQRLDRARRQALADRHTGIGFDQMLVIEAPRRKDTDAWIRIFNHDGNEVQQCGNGLRCIALYLHDVSHAQRHWRLDGLGGRVSAEVENGSQVSVAMSAPRFGAAVTGCKTQPPVRLDGQLIDFALVSMGNPHAVIAVPDVDTAEVDLVGTALQSFFVDGVNVGFCQRIAPGALSLRVWERGVGETRACGTGAAAAAVASMSRDPTLDEITVSLPGGRLVVRWAGEGESVWLRGPAQRVFEGRIEI